MALRPVHFEIQAADPARCAKFYTDVFGWFIEQWPGMEYWICYTTGEKTKWGDPVTGPGIDGGILPRKGGAPIDGAAVNAFVTTMMVENYNAIHDKILAAGGTLAVPKAALAGMAWQGYYKDTEGNIFGIHQTDVNAK